VIATFASEARRDRFEVLAFFLFCSTVVYCHIRSLFFACTNSMHRNRGRTPRRATITFETPPPSRSRQSPSPSPSSSSSSSSAKVNSSSDDDSSTSSSTRSPQTRGDPCTTRGLPFNLQKVILQGIEQGPGGLATAKVQAIFSQYSELLLEAGLTKAASPEPVHPLEDSSMTQVLGAAIKIGCLPVSSCIQHSSSWCASH
jgi:hypothetical protein